MIAKAHPSSQARRMESWKMKKYILNENQKEARNTFGSRLRSSLHEAKSPGQNVFDLIVSDDKWERACHRQLSFWSEICTMRLLEASCPALLMVGSSSFWFCLVGQLLRDLENGVCVWWSKSRINSYIQSLLLLVRKGVVGKMLYYNDHQGNNHDHRSFHSC